jgi:dTMP kinase
MARASRRNGAEGPDRFESEAQAFFERVRATYLERAQAEPARFRVIDGSRPIDAVSVAIEAALAPLLEASR